MDVAVDGWRVSAGEWTLVRSIPRDQLPQLSAEQREAARKMGVAEEDYARSVAAGERTGEMLLERAQRVAQLLDGMAREINRDARLKRLVLHTIEHRYDVVFELNRKLLLRIEEELVDDYFDGGSASARERLQRALRRTLTGDIQ